MYLLNAVIQIKTYTKYIDVTSVSNATYGHPLAEKFYLLPNYTQVQNARCALILIVDGFTAPPPKQLVYKNL